MKLIHVVECIHPDAGGDVGVVAVFTDVKKADKLCNKLRGEAIKNNPWLLTIRDKENYEGFRVSPIYINALL